MTPPDEPTLSPRLTALFAAACGFIVANIYYAQPLIAPIAAELGLPPRSAGLVVTLTQLGYGAGLLLIVPLADLVENRRLTLAAIALAALGLVGAGLLRGPAAFLACSLLIGFGSVAVQVLSPLAAHFAPAARRGRVVGDIAMGIMLGIMAARPAASFLAAETSWRTVFFAAAGLMALTAAALAVGLPKRQPESRFGYGALMASLIGLAMRTPVLQRRAFYQACLFAAFSLFWTTVPLFLADAFGLSQRGIALFALAGVSGAVAAPLSGRLADSGHSKAVTALALIVAAAAFVIANLAPAGAPMALALLVAAAVLLDFGAQAHLVVGFRAIFALGGESRGRLNGLYIATFFLFGALGSAVGAWAYADGGWRLASAIGLAFPFVALAAFAFERPR
jgi:predicted MFS family arabinose efflux permease